MAQVLVIKERNIHLTDKEILVYLFGIKSEHSIIYPSMERIRYCMTKRIGENYSEWLERGTK